MRKYHSCFQPLLASAAALLFLGSSCPLSFAAEFIPLGLLGSDGCIGPVEILEPTAALLAIAAILVALGGARFTRAALWAPMMAARPFLVALLLSAPALGQQFPLLHNFDDPSPTSNDFFGSAVALSEDYAVVGEYGHDLEDGDGLAHLFDPNSGELLRTLNAPGPSPPSRFGQAVAIYQDYLLVGHPTSGFRPGQAHLFDSGTGDLLHTFDDPTTSTGTMFFGRAVALSNKYAVVGGDRDSGRDFELDGQAHVFDVITGNYLHSFEDPTPQNEPGGGDRFGDSVAISGDYALVGDYVNDGDGGGQAHLFDLATGNFVHTFESPKPSPGNAFGQSVALLGEYALVGDPGLLGSVLGRAYLFNVTTGELLHAFDDPTMLTGSRFGESVALANEQLLIGARRARVNDSPSGGAYLYDIESGGLMNAYDDPTPSNVVGGEFFGGAVALSSSNALIGAERDSTLNHWAGQAHLFSTIIPEPRTATLVLLGMAAVVVRRWRVLAPHAPSSRQGSIPTVTTRDGWRTSTHS